jgi:hypothetical protein
MRNPACHSPDHQIARRSFLGGITAGASMITGGLGIFTNPALAAQLSSQQKRVLVIDLKGGASQLETWDPKPNTPTGGPFRAIPTSVPGVHISELLPYTAKQMHHLAIVRSVNTKENDHSKGKYCMLRGRKKTDPGEYPTIGAVMAKGLEVATNPLPGHIRISPKGKGSRGDDAAYLGARYASMLLDDGEAPQFSQRPESISEQVDQLRNQFRRQTNARFSQRRPSAATDMYTVNYEQALELVARREVFDVTKESTADQDRYGQLDFGRHCLLARRLLESGVTFVQLEHTEYDTHCENFDFHIEQLGEFDRPFATLVGDLADRGLLDSTLIVILSEFGRTPQINQHLGRDHWGTAWSVVLGGCGIQRGAVIGKTNENGTAVVDREVHHGHLFHTYLSAVGLDPTSHFEIGGRPIPLADPAVSGIKELLA